MLLAEKISSEGITPLEVQLRTMRALWAMAYRPDGTMIVAKALTAAAIAKEAAPYIHPKLATIDQNIAGSLLVGHVDAPIKEDRQRWLENRKESALAAVAALVIENA